MSAVLNRETVRRIARLQENEITEHHIYTRLAGVIKDEKNSAVLKRIGEDELRHYSFWRGLTGLDVKPNRWRAFRFYWIARIFGLTFGIKLMERGEGNAQAVYRQLADEYPEAGRIADDEEEHENALIALIEEKHLAYMGSVVLGLNDALVELTGALAGLSFALQNTRLIAMTGLITGIAASMSMAASEYLSTKSEGGENPLTSSLYTGAAYVATVTILILPYLLIDNYLVCLGVMLANAVLIIFAFNFYISIAKELDFKKRFLEMCAISLGVAALSFGIGVLVKVLIGIDV
ncbi:MAG TPA: VIT1/CCC1 transporter family protein [Spirochaetota bacterium]|nr:VIT1/CCC1 transporter family protein [Spirochaetota bacterium]HPV40532.1 VIT1/CCC1 transporter family protein [Spirochaetota bacterium]